MVRRTAASGIGPTAAPMLSTRYSILYVPGIAHVTDGCETMNFRVTCAIV